MMTFSLQMDAIQFGPYFQAAEILSSVEQTNIAPEEIISGDGYLRHFAFSDSEPDCLTRLELHGGPVFLLLPDSSLEEAKGAAYKQLLRLVPELSEHDNIFLFPYGRSSLQLALFQAGKMFAKGTAERVQLLGYYQDPRLINLQQGGYVGTADSGVASECLMAVTLCPAQHGFEIGWSSYEMHTPDKDLQTPIAALFQRYRQQCGQPVSQIYLPVIIEEPLRDAWAEGITGLETCVSERTQVVFADMYTGDLGHISGLYGLCHMLWRYRQGEYLGNSFQLDISSHNWRSAMMLRWSV